MFDAFIKYIYITLGSLAFAVGIVGIFLPVIPTTPCLMLACYFYSKGSTKFQTWLINSSIYKEYAQDFVENKSLTLKKKSILLTFASIMLLFPLFLLGGVMKLIIILLYIFLYYYFIFQIKTIR